MSVSSPELSACPSLDEARLRLQTPPRRRAPVWPLLLAAAFAAVMGVSVAGVTILGPGGGMDPVRTGAIHGQ